MLYKASRMCIVCRKRQTKENLIRLIKKDNSLCIQSGHIDGYRSVYICKDINCINTVEKKKLFNKILKIDPDTILFEKLKECCCGKN